MNSRNEAEKTKNTKEICREIYGSSFPVILAPMAGITDLAFRRLCKEQGCDAAVTEMVSAKALFYGNQNTLPLLLTEEEERPVGVQIFGSEPALMGDMARKLEERGFAFVDINMGCPVPKIVNNHEGSALMLDPELAGAIVREVKASVSLPVTVKFRLGYDKTRQNAVEFAGVLEENGADALAVHGRTREQYYSGRADWDAIRDVKEHAGVPVIANGDIFNGQDAVAIREITGCDGIMVARGARGNPWIFREIKAAFAGRPIPERPKEEEIIAMLLRQAKSCIRYKGEYSGIREMRKHAGWYVSGMRGAAKLRERINGACSLEELKAVFKQEEA